MFHRQNTEPMKISMKILGWLLFFGSFQEAKAAENLYQQNILTDTISVTSLHTSEPVIADFIEAKQVDTITADQIRRFYKSRNYQYAWITKEGLAENTQIFWDLYNQFENYSGDTSLYDPVLQEQLELLSSGNNSVDVVAQNLDMLEIRLTDFFITFLKRAYGGRVDPEKLQWHIPSKKLKVVALLDDLVTNAQDINNWLPVNAGYKAMREKVLQLKSLQAEPWPVISLGNHKVLKVGDTVQVIKVIKNRLTLLGDLPTADTTSTFDELFMNAVKAFQTRHGLTEDGIIGPAFLAAINMPLEAKIKQMLINMERMRWMPMQQTGKRVVVNIPEFRLHVYEGNADMLSMDVVVGKAATRTVIFSDRIKHVVFSPYWNLPQSIVRNEVLPGLERDSAYLDEHRMEIRGERNGLPIVRQKPGPGNALGRVKFIFPNRYIIYLHDTPAKQLFQRTTRAFSHGCIRVADPFALASYLLENREEWTDEKIKEAMYADKELWVNIEDPVPVYITYFTSWVDPAGKLNFRNDIYGHDEKLASHLF